MEDRSMKQPSRSCVTGPCRPASSTHWNQSGRHGSNRGPTDSVRPWLTWRYGGDLLDAERPTCHAPAASRML